jgi:hypothetical protein
MREPGSPRPSTAGSGARGRRFVNARRVLAAMAAIATLVLLVVLAWFSGLPGLRGEGPWRGPAASAAAPAAGAEDALASVPENAAADRIAPPTAAPAAGAPAQSQDAPAGWLARLQRVLEPRPATVVVDLCGIGRMPMPGFKMPPFIGAPVSEFVEKLPDALGLHPMREAWAQVRDALIARGGNDRAWALALEASSAMTSDGQLAEGWGRSPASQAAMIALAEQALTSTDATPLRLALGVCQLRPRAAAAGPVGAAGGSPDALGDARVDAACQALDAQRLADLDPSDAHHWLLRAAAATDPGSRLEALERAAAAPRLTAPFHRAAQGVIEAWPADRPSYLRLELMVRAIGAAAAIDLIEAPIAALAFCREAGATPADAHAGPGRLCDRLARLFLERSDTVQLAMFGPSIGRMAGWPEAEVLATRQALLSLMEAGNELIVGDLSSPWSCPSIAAVEQHFSFAARDGEVTALRALRAAPTSGENSGAPRDR